MSAVIYDEEKCSFCGTTVHGGLETPHAKRWGGQWDAKSGPLFCCPRCALSVLPAWIADSLHLPRHSHSATLQLPEVLASFWRAVAVRATSEVKNK